MRTVFVMLIGLLIISNCASALKQITASDDGYMSAKEGYKKVNVSGQNYFREVAPSFADAELVNNTPSIIIDQNHAGYLVFNIAGLDKIGPNNITVVKLYLDDTQPNSETTFASDYRSLYVSGPYSDIKDNGEKSGYSRENAGGDRGPGTAILADITQIIEEMQSFGVSKIILHLEPSSISDIDGKTKYRSVQIKSIESGHPAEIIII